MTKFEYRTISHSISDLQQMLSVLISIVKAFFAIVYSFCAESSEDIG